MGDEEEKRKKNQDHDDFARGILSLVQLVKKLLLYFLDDKIKRYINFDTLSPLSGDHVDQFLRVTHSDAVHVCDANMDALPQKARLLKKKIQFQFVFIWEHKSVWQSLPIDFQAGGYEDSLMRMDFQKQKGQKTLSIVQTILIYHGEKRWKKKRRYDHFEPYLPDELLECIPRPKMTVIDIQAMSHEDIENAIGLGELRAALIALKNAHNEEFFKHDLEKVINFVHEEEMQPKVLFDTYLRMLYEYMQRRSKLNNEQFQKVVEQSNSEDMVTQYKTIFQVAEEKAAEKATEKAICFAIKGFINTTRLSDATIALALNVSVELVKAIREEVKVEKRASALKRTRMAKAAAKN